MCCSDPQARDGTVAPHRKLKMGREKVDFPNLRSPPEGEPWRIVTKLWNLTRFCINRPSAKVGWD
jgi:hypothetical protein